MRKFGGRVGVKASLRRGMAQRHTVTYYICEKIDDFSVWF